MIWSEEVPFRTHMRSKPNARPYASGATPAARRSLRPRVRTPRPNHVVTRAKRTWLARRARPMRGFPKLYASNRRLLVFGAEADPQGVQFGDAGSPSAIPSRIPNQPGPAPIEAKKAGRIAAAIS